MQFTAFERHVLDWYLAKCLLFLEVFAYGAHFPEQLTDYRLLDGSEPT